MFCRPSVVIYPYNTKQQDFNSKPLQVSSRRAARNMYRLTFSSVSQRSVNGPYNNSLESNPQTYAQQTEYTFNLKQKNIRLSPTIQPFYQIYCHFTSFPWALDVPPVPSFLILKEYGSLFSSFTVFCEKEYIRNSTFTTQTCWLYNTVFFFKMF